MEGLSGLVADAINHAVAAEKRRREGLADLAVRHSSASRNALRAMARQAEMAAGRTR